MAPSAVTLEDDASGDVGQSTEENGRSRGKAPIFGLRAETWSESEVHICYDHAIRTRKKQSQIGYFSSVREAFPPCSECWDDPLPKLWPTSFSSHHSLFTPRYFFAWLLRRTWISKTPVAPPANSSFSRALPRNSRLLALQHWTHLWTRDLLSKAEVQAAWDWKFLEPASREARAQRSHGRHLIWGALRHPTNGLLHHVPPRQARRAPHS